MKLAEVPLAFLAQPTLRIFPRFPSAACCSSDTAQLYGNEASVGEAVRASGIPREEIWVTTKIWNTNGTFEATLEELQKCFDLLNIGYIDLVLLHKWGLPSALSDRVVCPHKR